MNSLFSMFFGRNNAAGMEGYEAASTEPSQGMVLDEEKSSTSRKRSLVDATSKPAGAAVPKLVPAPGQDEKTEGERPLKRFRGETRVISVTQSSEDEEAKLSDLDKTEPSVPASSPLQKLPEDVMAHCLSFLGCVEDRFALQCTSKQFRRISNTEPLMSKVAVGGDRTTGLHGLIQEDDTPETASEHLTPYAQAGNLEAIYMLGIIMSYCHQDVKEGILLLKRAASNGYVRASYALGLALRDTEPEVAVKFMQAAADDGYIPALQELLPPREMKDKYGEPKAEELRLHLDPLCLNRLLTRYYTESAELRDLNTSHCWNPLCGRWAFKANAQPHPGPDDHSAGWHLHRNASDINAHAAHGHVNSNGTQKETLDTRVSRMKMCSRCCRAKYCSKLCQVYDWRSGRHKMECQFL